MYVLSNLKPLQLDLYDQTSNGSGASPIEGFISYSIKLHSTLT